MTLARVATVALGLVLVYLDLTLALVLALVYLLSRCVFYHVMQKKFGNGACGVRMRRRKRLGLLSNQGAVHQALARFHSEHVGN